MDDDEFVALTVKMKPALLEAVETAQAMTGEGTQQFIRNAIAELVRKKGIKLHQDAHLPRSRKGVGRKPAPSELPTERSRIAEVKTVPRKLDLDDPRDLETMAKAGMIAAGITPRLRPEASSKAASTTESKSALHAHIRPGSTRGSAPQGKVPK